MDLNRDVAKALGPDWHVEPHDSWTVLRHADGYGCTLNHDAYDHRITIRPSWPSRSGYGQFVPSRTPLASASITVADTKTPVQIAADITRRFLPVYVPLWHDQQAHALEHDRYRATATKTARVVAKILGCTASQIQDAGNGSITIYPRQFYQVRITGDFIALDLSSLTLDEAVPLLRVLARTAS